MTLEEAYKENETNITIGANGKSYIFFWGGPYSNWHMQSFEYNGQKYNCAEQYMMQQKALVMGDDEIAKTVMEARFPSAQKYLGRQVRNFDYDKWMAVCEDLMVPALVAKFTASDWLKETILRSGDAHIVEASPYDTIWGVGLAADDPLILDEKNWRGMNLLGEVLMRAREIIRGM